MTIPGMTAPALDEHTDDALDAALVARWLGGDERAATELVYRHAPALGRFAASLGERAEADEIVQDTFVRAFQALEGFRAESSLRTWLFTIARRLVLDRRRAGARRRAREVDAEPDAATDHTALDVVLANETQLRLRGAVARLTPMQREVFTLRVARGSRTRRSRRSPAPPRAPPACTTTTPFGR
jgi:RNA polymerase sigma-70 factor (ECF subfamily)